MKTTLDNCQTRQPPSTPVLLKHITTHSVQPKSASKTSGPAVAEIYIRIQCIHVIKRWAIRFIYDQVPEPHANILLAWTAVARSHLPSPDTQPWSRSGWCMVQRSWVGGRMVSWLQTWIIKSNFISHVHMCSLIEFLGGFPFGVSVRLWQCMPLMAVWIQSSLKQYMLLFLFMLLSAGQGKSNNNHPMPPPSTYLIHTTCP